MSHSRASGLEVVFYVLKIRFAISFDLFAQLLTQRGVCEQSGYFKNWILLDHFRREA